ncbi:hypothetical protein RF55_10426 [Lasius niger]|uniref:Uncharacterized protein n=1 Tax=Lasius niger TaxID=67767 RepID=A0A0J7KI36_LASNI|nr:hypothetical protein RF55_10426 [Lasius niger]
MGLRGLTGAPHLDSGYADLDATERLSAEGAQGLFSSRESGVHQAKEQQQTADAAAVLQETQPEHERLERPVQVILQVGRKVGWPPVFPDICRSDFDCHGFITRSRKLVVYISLGDLLFNVQ